jgi:uncharacterized protein YrrD
MKNNQIKGIGVISIAEGKKLGTIARSYFDPESRRVVGFVIHQGGGILSTEPDRHGIVDVSEVHSLGPDALMVEDESAFHGEETSERYAELLDLDELMARKVVTEGGTQVGDIAALDFDERTFALRAVEVSPSFFQSNREIPADQVVSIGGDVLVVSDAVVASKPEMNADSTAATEGRHFVVVDERAAE